MIELRQLCSARDVGMKKTGRPEQLQTPAGTPGRAKNTTPTGRPESAVGPFINRKLANKQKKASTPDQSPLLRVSLVQADNLNSDRTFKTFLYGNIKHMLFFVHQNSFLFYFGGQVVDMIIFVTLGG